MSRSAGLISTSTASTSGRMATVAAEVWILPCASVSGTRCTRCTPLSYFMVPYTSSPIMENVTSFVPPIPVSFRSRISTFHPLLSPNREYIRSKSEANNAASSPPVPARISTMTFLLSLGSFGMSRTFSSSSSSWTFAVADVNSSYAIWRMSASGDESAISRRPSRSFFAFA